MLLVTCTSRTRAAQAHHRRHVFIEYPPLRSEFTASAGPRVVRNRPSAPLRWPCVPPQRDAPARIHFDDRRRVSVANARASRAICTPRRPRRSPSSSVALNYNDGTGATMTSPRTLLPRRAHRLARDRNSRMFRRPAPYRRRPFNLCWAFVFDREDGRATGAAFTDAFKRVSSTAIAEAPPLGDFANIPPWASPRPPPIEKRWGSKGDQRACPALPTKIPPGTAFPSTAPPKSWRPRG